MRCALKEMCLCVIGQSMTSTWLVNLFTRKVSAESGRQKCSRFCRVTKHYKYTHTHTHKRTHTRTSNAQYATEVH